MGTLFLTYSIKICFMHMSILSAYTYVYHVHSGHLWGSEEDIGFIGTGAGDEWELPDGCWGQNPTCFGKATKVLNH